MRSHPFPIRSPLLLLLTINLAVGLFTFRNYGLSWDEPLFYDYANSIWEAYTPQAFSPGFDFESVYGRSPDDHKIYGPAYLLLARPVQQMVVTLFDVDMASAWHLVNFLTFQIGLVGFYRLSRRWFDPWPATLTTAFLSWQPVFWGHAFINPKDMPFMVFFLWSLTLGLEMVDVITAPDATQRQKATKTLLAALLLGLTSAIRIIGPLAGVLVGLYFLLCMWQRKNQYAKSTKKHGTASARKAFSVHFRKFRVFRVQVFKTGAPSAWLTFLAYGLLAMLFMYAFWPYLWADPLNRLLAVLRHMSNNPTELAVLFLGQIFRANEMPRRYLPTMLTLTLTEPTWIMFTAGVILATRQILKKVLDFRAPLVVLTLFGFMLGYLLYFTPSIYDGFRHFLFILPPVFLFCGFVFQWLADFRHAENTDSIEKYGQNHLLDFFSVRIRRFRAFRVRGFLAAGIVSVLLLPGLLGIGQMHPYEYAYYNRFAGGVGGAYRVYETEYWLTCFKEAAEWVKYNEPATTLHVQREFPIAAYYAEGLNLKDLAREPEASIQTGDLMLFHTRANLDIRSIYRKLPVVTSFGRGGAEFCIIKRKD